jgi:Fe-S oxidoreductase
MCNGAGVCRKRTTGVMCPSFIATREEEHSTRGRANALQAAMSGVLPANEFTSKRMYEVMDLCVSCKACKAECPSSVDMGKIKVEFLAQYYKANGTPLRSRLFGHIALLSRLSSGWRAPLANWTLQNPLVRNLMERFGGISQKRQLPPFARVPFTDWFKQRPKATSGRKQVVLFNDTFNTYNYPHIAIAATEALESLGYEVILPAHKCCGRPMVSKGLVEGARKLARDTVEKLLPYAQKGIPIVGLEPSCYLTIRDEYSYLLPGSTALETVQANTYGIDEFIVKMVEQGELDLHLTSEERKLLLHGHCHQKALVGTGPVKTMLGLPEHYSVEEVDTSCCGMAGAFGYEHEHYDISMKMSEQRLAPAVRAADDSTLIVAMGTSCREQIRHTTGKHALHPAEVLRDALVKDKD